MELESWKGGLLLLSRSGGVIREAQRLAAEHGSLCVHHYLFCDSADDLESVRHGRHLKERIVSRRRFETSVADRMVQFILSDACVRAASWVTKAVDNGGEVVRIPGLMRLATISELYRRYVVTYPDDALRLTAGPFCAVCKALTVPNSGCASSLSYIYTDNVVHVQVTNLRLARHFVNSRESLARIRRLLQLATFSLKCVCVRQSRLCSEQDGALCAIHNTGYALGIPRGYDNRSHEVLAAGRALVPCSMLTNVMLVLDEIAALIGQSTRPDDEKRRGQLVLRGNRDKWFKYLQHMVRCRHQAAAIESLRMETEGRADTAYVVMDYKQKLEPLQKRGDPSGGYLSMEWLCGT